jgi:hypothetical protein
MADRQEELDRLAAEVRRFDDVLDAFTAKSFTDMLVIVDIASGETVPAQVVEHLDDHDVYPIERVYDDDDAARTFVGSVGEGTRHHFVDSSSRGTHHSYVVE